MAFEVWRWRTGEDQPKHTRSTSGRTPFISGDSFALPWKDPSISRSEFPLLVASAGQFLNESLGKRSTPFSDRLMRADKKHKLEMDKTGIVMARYDLP